MVHRQILIGMVLCLGVSVLLTAHRRVEAQEQPTAQELFDQAMQEYANDDYVSSQKTFRRIDPLQLNKQQRLIMYETVQNIDRHIRENSNPDKLLNDAKDAQDQGKLSEATALYQSILHHPGASEEQKDRANASIAEIKRRLNAQLTRARRAIDEADRDIQGERYRAAERKLQAIKESGIELGWFEKERIDRQLTIISERLATKEEQTEEAQPPTPPVETPPLNTNTQQVQTPPPDVEKGTEQASKNDLSPPDNELEQREQEIAQREMDLQKKNLQEQLQQEEAIKKQSQLRQAEQERDLAEREQQLKLLESQLANREKTIREKAQQQRAQREQAAREQAAYQQQLEEQARLERERGMAIQQKDSLAEQEKLLTQALSDESEDVTPTDSTNKLAYEQPPQQGQSPTDQSKLDRVGELTERERQLVQWEQQLARQEKELDQWVTELDQLPGANENTGAYNPLTDTQDILAQARHLHVQEKMINARNALNAKQYHLASQLYQEVLDLEPGHAKAAEGLARAQERADRMVGPRGVLETEIQARTVRTDAAIAEFEELMHRATQLLENQAFAAARESVQQAKITLDLNQRFLPTTRYRTLRDNAVNLAARIADSERIAEEAQRRELEIARRTEAEKRRAEALLAQQEETQRLLKRAADLRREQKYDQALELLNQSLFLDPHNVAAQAMKEMIEDSQLYVKTRDQLRERNLMVAEQSSNNIGATTPYTDLMTYPSDWPRLTATRLAGLDPRATESEVNRVVALKLKDSVPINFETNKLVNIIEYLRNTTGVNFFVNWPILESVGVTKDMPVTLQLTNVPVSQALRLVLEEVSAANEADPVGFSIIEGVVTVSTERDLSKTTDIRPYDIRDMLVQVPNFSDAPEFDLNAALSNTNSGGSNQSGGEGGGGDSGGLFGGGESEEEKLTREERIQQILDLITDTVGKPDDWENQGGPGSIRELNGNLIVKSTPKNHRQIAQLLAQLRETRAIQIAVEGRFLLVDQNFLDEVGVDLDITFFNDDDPNGFGDVEINQDSISIAERNTGLLTPNPFRDQGGSLLRSFDLGVSYMDDIQVNLMIRATQASRRSITLTAPRLTLFNGQRAYVIVARQITFISDLEPVPDGGGFDTTLSVVNSGVILDVEATVSADRRYVTMTVRPSLATLVGDEIRRIEQRASVIVGDGTVGIPLTLEAFIEAPELELTSVKTSVSVPDRGTLLIGGQRLVADTQIEAGVPVLSKIPVLNRLFTNTSTVQDERTLLILIKPTIIIQSEEEEQVFPGLLQDPQKYGVGHRF